ncbi:MAG: hypothetical protein LRZ85_02205 [Alphaproteobacteria bacterium]|nr:hypothetical protein [Alphaproteobacteria bacterium]MCD8526496.1 hypothetical protein [Alphaproteobacteria bacterium]MCD8570365.1 hypothetical protein [Alphaproteobacteria bacterium]
MRYSFPLLMGLIVFSMGMLFLFPKQMFVTGILMILWAGFALIRGLWMAELLFFGHVAEEEKLAAGGSLSQTISSNRDRSVMREACYKAINTFSDKTAIWLALAGCYGVWVLGTALFPVWPWQYQDLREMITSFPEMDLEAGYISFFNAQKALTPPMLIACAYYLATSFAGSAAQGRVIVTAALTGFTISAFVLVIFVSETVTPAYMALSGHWFGYGPGMAPVLQSMEIIPEQTLSAYHARVYELGMGGTVFLYVLGLYQGLLFISALNRGTRQRIYAVAGLFALLALWAADHYFPAGSRFLPFWLSGWIILAVATVQSRSLGIRSSRLRQI